MNLGRRPSRRWGWVAAAWAVAFAGLHVYWAMGGTVGLAESAGARLAEERPTWFVVGGLYGVAATLLTAAALAVALARVRITDRRRLLPLLGLGLAAVLLLRAVVVEVLLLSDAGYGKGAVSADQRWWSLVLWNPWFLAGGATFALAALGARSRRSPT